MSENIFVPLTDNNFKFRCHKDIECFNECCAALKLVLTPYDILRLKSRLEISSEEFLAEYSDTTLDRDSLFPKMTLKMNEDEKQKCPFVSAEGCSIYEDRPGACRVYPLGRASMKLEKEKNAREKFFIVKEDHCLGFEEEKVWDINEWMTGEGLDRYNSMNDKWLEIISSKKSMGDDKDVPKKIQMFSMVSYNLDKFKEFVFKSRFLDLFDVDQERKFKINSNDEELLLFGFDWLKFSLYGEKTIKVKSQ